MREQRLGCHRSIWMAENGLRFIESIESNIGTTSSSSTSSTAGGAEYPIIRAHSGPSVHITVYQGRCGRRLCPAHHGLSYIPPPDEARSFDNQKFPRRPILSEEVCFPLYCFLFRTILSVPVRHRSVFCSGMVCRAGPGRAVAGGGCAGRRRSRSWRFQVQPVAALALSLWSRPYGP